MANFNGFLDYSADGVRNSFGFYVVGASQPFRLSGDSVQTRLHKQFFPKGYSPGNMSITGQVTSQKSLQQFARFVREHHVALINTPGSMAFTRIDTNSPGYNRLLRLFVVGEDILYRGWIPSFTIQKRGVFEPVPQFTFDFFPVFDQHATNIYASRQIEKLWWQQSGSPQIKVGGSTVEKAPIVKDPAVGDNSAGIIQTPETTQPRSKPDPNTVIP